MASEGLDIKTLTTLILASPKTDVCQSVGRILRQKHSSPLVIDIIDGHDIFMSQWYKRRKYYKSQDYKILVCDNMEYDTQGFKNDLAKWKVSWAPKGDGVSAGVSKKIQATKAKVVAAVPTKTATNGKSIAEKLNIKINIKGGIAKKGKNIDDEDEDEDEDDDEVYDVETNDDNEEVDERTYSDSDSDDDESSMHKKKRKTMRGKSGLVGKGCLIDITNL
jgi:superfamily II DNA or RNA helicase